MGMNRLNRKTSGGVKCVIVGDGGVGKTSLLMSYTSGGIMMDYIPTCFDCYTVDMNLHDASYTMTLVDTAGQETYDRLRTLSYFDTDIFVVCFNIADEDSFENVKTKWIQELKQYRPDTPFILVGTQTDKRKAKADGNGHLPNSYIDRKSVPTKCVSTKKGKSTARKLGAKQYLECSALNCEGVAEVFSSALQTAMCRKKRRQSFLKTCMPAFKFRKFGKDKRVED